MSDTSMRELIHRANSNGKGEFVPPKYREPIADLAPGAIDPTGGKSPITAAPTDYSKNVLAQRFMEVGDTIAKQLEEQGDTAAKVGQERKDQFYKEAAQVRTRAERQAKEAIEYIENLKQIQALTGPNKEAAP